MGTPGSGDMGICPPCGLPIHKGLCIPDIPRQYDVVDPRSKGTPGSGDAVNHPSHYTFGKYEVVDVIFDWQPPYPLDNVIKYVARAGKKGGPEKELEDLKKAQFYLNYYIAQKEK
jgi:hypothetical protein